MGFIIDLPRTPRRYDFNWIIVKRFTKSAHSLSDRTTYSAKDYAKLHIEEIIRFHGTPVSVITNRGAQLTTNF